MSTQAKYLIYSLGAALSGLRHVLHRHSLLPHHGSGIKLLPHGAHRNNYGYIHFRHQHPHGNRSRQIRQKTNSHIKQRNSEPHHCGFRLNNEHGFTDYSRGVFEGVSEAASAASISALLAAKADDTKRNSVFSMFGFANSTAFGVRRRCNLGDNFDGGVLHKESHVLLYVVLAALSLSSTLIMLKVTEPRTQQSQSNLKSTAPQKIKKRFGKIRRNRRHHRCGSRHDCSPDDGLDESTVRHP